MKTVIFGGVMMGPGGGWRAAHRVLEDAIELACKRLIVEGLGVDWTCSRELCEASAARATRIQDEKEPGKDT